MRVLVQGAGDIGSAIAHRLFREGYEVVIHDNPQPTTTRRGMAFADAIFVGRASLEGVEGILCDDWQRIERSIGEHAAIPIYTRPLGPLLIALAPTVLVDARMQKHSAPEVQRRRARFTIGLGPDLVAGHHADVIIETSWEDLGRVITLGSSLPLRGEPREIEGHARDRYVYASIDGVFHTKAKIGDVVEQGEVVAEVGPAGLLAPIAGVLRGLTRDGVLVTARTKVVEIDPRGRTAELHGIAERPPRIADGVLTAIRSRESERT
jgi:xanthine dehydrogenase accessory factor